MLAATEVDHEDVVLDVACGPGVTTCDLAEVTGHATGIDVTPAIPHVDEGRLMVPPWIKFPNIPLGSMGWRMGMGEAYMEEHARWYSRQARETHKRIWLAYPEPDKWSGYYKRLKR